MILNAESKGEKPRIEVRLNAKSIREEEIGRQHLGFTRGKERGRNESSIFEFRHHLSFVEKVRRKCDEMHILY